MRRLAYLMLQTVLWLLIAHSVFAAPELVKNIETAPNSTTLGSANGAIIGSTFIFGFNNGSAGKELYKVDLNTGVLTLVMDIEPGATGSEPASFVQLDSTRVVFTATTSTNGNELWITDGTASGTAMVADIRAGAASSFPGYLNAGNSKVYFVADDGISGRELWVSNGTLAGTTIFDLNAGATGSEPDALTIQGGFLFFNFLDATFGREGGIINTVTNGYSFLGDINSGAASSTPYHFYFVGGSVIFSADDGVNGREPFVYSGGAPTLIEDCNPGAGGSNPVNFQYIGTQLYFLAQASGIANHSLWTSTDGTPTGTSVLASLTGYPGAILSSATLDRTATVNGRYIFELIETSIPEGSELFGSDLTAPGSGLLKSFVSGSVSGSPRQFTNHYDGVNNNLVFTAGSIDSGVELWVTDGTTVGTTLLIDIGSGTNSSAPIRMAFDTTSNTSVWLVNVDVSGTKRLAIYKTNGTVGGTSQVTLLPDVNLSFGSYPSSITKVFDNKVLFAASTFDLGSELWLSDGTSAGTSLLKDISSGFLSSAPNSFIEFNNKVFFFASTHDTGNEPWITDGTTAGTQILADIRVGEFSSSPMFLGTLSNKILFAASIPSTGIEMYATDGTPGGTSLVSDFYSGATSGISATNLPAIVLNDRLLVGIDRNDGLGSELYSTDGTVGGTVLVKDISSGASSSGPAGFMRFGDSVIFIAGGVGVSGTQLWKTDGTTVGTVLLKDINPGGSIYGGSEYETINGRLIFVLDDGIHGYELWSTDGTTAGTDIIADINAGSLGSGINNFAKLNNSTLYFTADDGVHGTEVWVTDGTVLGTRLIKDINPGSARSINSDVALKVIADRLFIAAQTVSNGEELWSSDGTEAGTTLLHEFTPGAENSTVIGLTAVNGTLFFTAATIGFDAELWKLVYDSCPTDDTKLEPGTCGCGVSDADANLNGQADCLDPTVTTVPTRPIVRITKTRRGVRRLSVTMQNVPGASYGVTITYKSGRRTKTIRARSTNPAYTRNVTKLVGKVLTISYRMTVGAVTTQASARVKKRVR